MRPTKVHVLMYNDGNDFYPLAVFKRKPSDKKLAELEISQGLETVEEVREAFLEFLSWDTVYCYN